MDTTTGPGSRAPLTDEAIDIAAPPRRRELAAVLVSWFVLVLVRVTQIHLSPWGTMAFEEGFTAAAAQLIPHLDAWWRAPLTNHADYCRGCPIQASGLAIAFAIGGPTALMFKATAAALHTTLVLGIALGMWRRGQAAAALVPLTFAFGPAVVSGQALSGFANHAEGALLGALGLAWWDPRRPRAVVGVLLGLATAWSFTSVVWWLPLLASVRRHPRQVAGAVALGAAVFAGFAVWFLAVGLTTVAPPGFSQGDAASRLAQVSHASWWLRDMAGPAPILAITALWTAILVAVPAARAPRWTVAAIASASLALAIYLFVRPPQPEVFPAVRWRYLAPAWTALPVLVALAVARLARGPQARRIEASLLAPWMVRHRRLHLAPRPPPRTQHLEGRSRRVGPPPHRLAHLSPRAARRPSRLPIRHPVPCGPGLPPRRPLR